MRKKTSKSKTKQKINPHIPSKLTFRIPEFTYYPKTIWWALSASLIIGLVLINLYLTQQYFPILIVILGLIILLKYSTQRPEHITVKLDRRGIKIKNHFYPWRAFLSFSVVNQKNGIIKIYLHHPRFFLSPLSFDIPPNASINIIELQKFLRTKLPEKFLKRLHFIDSINQFLRL